MNRLLPRFIGLIIIQVLVLSVMVAVKQYTLLTGESILLQTDPIDPRSLFRGDYVRLNYTISTITLADNDASDDLKEDKTVYVTLKKAGKYWTHDTVKTSKPLNDHPFIKGKIFTISENDQIKSKKELHIDYGIETYFVPEGEGITLENLPGDKILDVDISLDRFGNAAIKRLYIDDAVVYEESLF